MDMMRALAAMAVMISHARALFLTTGMKLQNPSKPLQLLYLVSGWGHSAVMIFFVLSGFFVGGSVLSARDRWSWKSYGIARGTRLYLVLIPALLLTLLWDHVGILTGSNIYDNTHATTIIPYVVAEHQGPTNFWGNWVFLQSLGGRPAGVFPYGSNSPLWSLSNEFWYYVLFPLLVLGLLAQRTPLWRRVLYLGLAGVLAATLCRVWMPGFVVWLLGAGVAILPHFKISRAVGLPLVIALIAILCGTLTLTRSTSSVMVDIVLAIETAALIYALLLAQGGIPAPRLYGRLARGLAAFSYTLYAVHLPLLVYLRARICPTERLYPTGKNLLIFASMCLIAIAYAGLISLVTEHQTERVRKFLDRRPGKSVEPGDGSK